MENSFLKDAINRIVELATPFTLETRNGHQFCSADLREVKPEVELPARYSVDTLEALVKLIRTEGVAQAPQLYVRVDSARRVVVDSTYTGRDYAIYSRLPLYEAVSDVPSISVNQYMSQEHAVIELQSLYAVTDDRDYLLALLSRIDVNQGVSSVDNGISQEVSVRTGAVAQSQTLVLLAQQLNTGNGDALRTIAQMAQAILRNVPPGALTEEERNVMPHFKNPAMPSVAVTADAAIKIATAREEFASTDTFLEMIGFDQADIRRIRAQEQRVRGQQVLMEMEDEDNDAGVGDVHPQAGEAE